MFISVENNYCEIQAEDKLACLARVSLRESSLACLARVALANAPRLNTFAFILRDTSAVVNVIETCKSLQMNGNQVYL